MIQQKITSEDITLKISFKEMYIINLAMESYLRKTDPSEAVEILCGETLKALEYMIEKK